MEACETRAFAIGADSISQGICTEGGITVKYVVLCFLFINVDWTTAVPDLDDGLFLSGGHGYCKRNEGIYHRDELHRKKNLNSLPIDFGQHR